LFILLFIKIPDCVLYKQCLILLITSLPDERERVADLSLEIFVNDLALFDLALGLDIDDELRANSNLALNLHRSSHLLYEPLTDTETKPCPLLVALRVLIQFVEVYE
jgi:hypothetical protein